MTPDEREAARKYARQDMAIAQKHGAVCICETKMGTVELSYDDGLFRLSKDGEIVFQAYQHTPEVFVDNMITRVYTFA